MSQLQTHISATTTTKTNIKKKGFREHKQHFKFYLTKNQKGKWTDKYITDKHTMSELDVILNSKPKLGPLLRNRARSEEKRPTEHANSHEKPKIAKKTSNKQASNKKKAKIEFEDFIFEEPPPDEFLEEKRTDVNADSFKQDDEFWKFYEQKT